MRALLISGSTRAASTNGAALLTLAELARLAGASESADRYDGLVALPAFNPDDDHEPLPGVVADLRARIARADAVVFCTPEYAGTVPGSLKNLLDWTVGATVLSAKPTAWINVAAPGRGTGAIATLEMVLRYVGAALVPGACRSIPVSREMVGADGQVSEPAPRDQLAAVWAALDEAVGQPKVNE